LAAALRRRPAPDEPVVRWMAVACRPLSVVAPTSTAGQLAWR